MSFHGVKSPECHVLKSGTQSSLKEVDGAKSIKEQELRFGQPSDIGPAPTSRIYTRDYTKGGRSVGDIDLVTEALGNPLRL